ncbi:TPA: hypothetical protein ACHBVP_000761 [Klebsiella pneumoniae]
MNIETVNELIQSLDGAGELSIKERKYLELAKPYLDVAAENVALKSYRYTLDEIKSSLVGGGHGHMAKADMQAQSAVLDVIFDAFDDIETPATDAYLAGIKADGVEMFAKHCDDSIGFVEPEDEELYTLMEEQAREFAKQLREGADK